MKLAFYTVMVPSLEPRDAVQLGRDLGFDGIEWRVAPVDPAVRAEPPSFFRNNRCTLAVTDSEAERARRSMEEAGLSVPNLGTYIDVGDMESVVRHMRFAQIIGAPSLRIGTAPMSNDYVAERERSAQFIRDVEPVAREHGVRAVVETHFGTVCASATQARAMVEGRDPEWIGVLYDVGNMVFEGFEDYRAGVQTIGSYLHLVHLKNAILTPKGGGGAERRWAPLDAGLADIDSFLDTLQASGYDGWLVIEDFSTQLPDRVRLAYDHAWLTAKVRERWG